MKLKDTQIYILVALLFASSTINAQEVHVSDAMVKNSTINDAEIILKRYDKTLARTNTDINGHASFPDLKDDKNIFITVKKSGYTTLETRCPCRGLTYAIYPKITDLNGLRIALTWNDKVRDLDAHLISSEHHVFSMNVKENNEQLEFDDTSFYGPEVITIKNIKQESGYIYAVHNFSKRPDIVISKAKVNVYIGESLIKTYKIKPYRNENENGDYWIVFGLDNNGLFYDIDKLSKHLPNNPSVYLNKIINDSYVLSNKSITDNEKKEANYTNFWGEEHYKEKDYQGALDAFNSAIRVDSKNGKYYSNLAIAYSKIGRNSESLWANNVAIALTKSNTVKSSCYYNIGRIYEGLSEWQQALNNYSLALKYKENIIYRNSIIRIEKKLKIK